MYETDDCGKHQMSKSYSYKKLWEKIFELVKFHDLIDIHSSSLTVPERNWLELVVI